MSLWQAMSRFDGRIPRKYVWLAAIVWGLIFLVISMVLFHWQSGGRWLDEAYNNSVQATKDQSVASLIAFLLLLYPSLAVTIQRLHDLNRPGWWCLPYYAFSFLYMVIGVVAPASIAYQIVLWVCMIVMLVYTIILGFFRGTQGPNDYGPDPLATTSVGAVAA